MLAAAAVEAASRIRVVENLETAKAEAESGTDEAEATEEEGPEEEEIDDIMFSDSSLEDRLSNNIDNRNWGGSTPDQPNNRDNASLARGYDSASPQSFRSVKFSDRPATPLAAFVVRGAARVSPEPVRHVPPLSERLAQLEEWMF